MPNNCSTLIQRKQNILHKILRSNSDGKIQNAVAETTAELCVAGTRKTSAYSTSPHHLTLGATAASTAHRSNGLSTNRMQPSNNHHHDTRLPSIRDTSNGYVERQNYSHDEPRSRPGSKTPLASTSPKSIGRPPSASMSSFFNALAKRSTENFMSTNGEIEETIIPNAAPPGRRSHRLSKGGGSGGGINQNTTKQAIVSHKQSGDSGIDIRFSSSSGDTNQQPKPLGLSTRLRTNVSQAHMESPVIQETGAKERITPGQHYQRRQNNTVKAPIKQKIDKYRRSEEATHAINEAPTSTARPKPPPPSPAAVRRVTSDAEIQARLEVLRLSMDTNLPHLEHYPQTQPHQYSRNRVKSPYLYTTHQQLTPTSTPQTPTILRQSHRSTQGNSSANSSQHHHINDNMNNRRTPQQQQQRQYSVKKPPNTSAGNLYLAFIASHHLSTLEHTLLECDIDHQKLLRIFTWLKGVEEHRHEQLDHEQLLMIQNQLILDQEENLSLYSEIQYAVDDLPANTTGKPCEKIAPMQFED